MLRRAARPAANSITRSGTPSTRRKKSSDEAADQYYSNVVMAYEQARRKGEWFDDSARAFFARAAFALADHYEAKGLDRQALRILQHVARSDVPAADEARKRIDRLETKGRIL